MATTAATLNAERWADIVIIKCTAPADVLGAPMSESFTVPAGLGDVAILSILGIASAVDAIPATNLFPAGLEATVGSVGGGALVDIVGVAAWHRVGDTATAQAFTCHIDPDALALWRQNELLSFRTVEVDSDATPTGDFTAYVKAVRVREPEIMAGPIQLVR